jgi:hypothetical protein
MGRSGPRLAQASRSSPLWGPVVPRFDLAAIRSPEAKSHTSTHSSSTAEEQQREGHLLGEERVELVV